MCEGEPGSVPLVRRPKEEAKTREKADSGGFVGSLRDRVTRVTQLMPKRDRKEQDLASQLFGEARFEGS